MLLHHWAPACCTFIMPSTTSCCGFCWPHWSAGPRIVGHRATHWWEEAAYMLPCAPAKCLMAYWWPSQTYQMGNCYSWGGWWIFMPGSHTQCSIWFNMKVLHMNRWLDCMQVQIIEPKQFLICLLMPWCSFKGMWWLRRWKPGCIYSYDLALWSQSCQSHVGSISVQYPNWMPLGGGWKVVFTCMVCIFIRLEECHLLERNNPQHRWLLHYLFLDLINKDCEKFHNEWNAHLISGVAGGHLPNVSNLIVSDIKLFM